MIITRGQPWYRPYRVTASGRNYFLEKIVFFEKDGIMVETRSGWLENERGTDLPELYLPVESLKVKRKATLNTNEPYLISLGKDYSKENKAVLYIPMDMVNLHLEEYKIMYGYNLTAIYKGEQDIYFTSHVKPLGKKLWDLREEYENTRKEMDDCSMNLAKREKFMEKIESLKSIVEKFYEEKERLDNLTVEEVLKDL